MTIVSRTIFEMILGATTITLPRPIVNDTKTQQYTRINRHTRGLTRKMYSSPDWFRLEVHDYTFQNLTKILKDNLVTFITQNVGTAITVVDHLSVSRTMYVESTAPVVEQRNDDCSFTVGVILREVL